MNTLIETLDFILSKIPYFSLGLILIFLGKIFYDITTAYNVNKHLAKENNNAVGISLVGYLIGLSLPISTILNSTSDSILNEVIGILLLGLILIILLRLSMLINDLIILYKFKIGHEIAEQKNAGTGYVVGGMCIATGLMLSGVMSGESEGISSLVIDIFVYWIFGQIILIIDGIVFQIITRYDLHETIEKENNSAAGISFGAFLVSQGMITKIALTGASSNYGPELLITAIIAITGLILLVIGRVIIDKIFLPKANLSFEISKNKNTAAAILAAGIFIIIAIIFSSVANPNSISTESIMVIN